MATQLPTIDLDNSPANADWTKQSWDLPPYKSNAFFSVVPADQLPGFRNSAAYNNAVKAGLIMDDEWVADMVELAEPDEGS